MFVAIRDLLFARGRFALMGSVVALITLLVVMLSGLTAGLARENISAIEDLPAEHLVFEAPGAEGEIDFGDSTIPAQTATEWAQMPGVQQLEPLTIVMTRAQVDDRSVSVSAFAVAEESALAPEPVASEHVVLSEGAAEDLGVGPGAELEFAGHTVQVQSVAGQDSYSHTPVVWMSALDLPDDDATVLALTSEGADLATADAELGTQTVPVGESVQAIGSYAAENGSLQLMRGLLLAISALVIGAFFTVWTVQRSGEIAVLKAVGASTGYVLRDAVGQALVLLLIGTGTGAAAATGLGFLAAGSVPFVLNLTTVAVPAALLIGLGLLGAAVSLRRVTTVDPLTALGSAR
ncbi:MAG TPA: ABC transporter permease [Beutenbergiaceae bacterium]|nr:ABC transporter permease [Beutenbergiaceae bacterium]